MQKGTPICYLSSLLFYGMGYMKMRVINNAVTEHLTTYDYTIYASLATGYFVLAIFFAVIGSLFFYVKNSNQKIITIKDIELRVKAGGRLDQRRVSLPALKAQLKQPKYNLDLYKRMSS